MNAKEKHWNCHEHKEELRVSDFCTIYHPDTGQLCIGEHHWNCVLFYPIEFKTKTEAKKWIEEGTIAQLQEAYGNLDIGFTKLCFSNR